MNFLKRFWKNSRWILNNKGGGVVGAIASAAIPSVVSGITGGKGKKKAAGAYAMPPGMAELMSSLYPYLQTQLTAPPAYPGELVAGISPYEKRGLGLLGTYMGAPPSPYYGLAGRELERTMEGGYDPFTSEYYKAMRKGQMKELKEAGKRLGEEAATRGLYYSGPRLSQQRELEEGVTTNLGQILATLSERERARRLGAVPELERFAGTMEARPLEQSKAGLLLGALPRTLEQAGLTSKYNEWLRRQGVSEAAASRIISYLSLLQQQRQANQEAMLAAGKYGTKTGAPWGTMMTNILGGLSPGGGKGGGK